MPVTPVPGAKGFGWSGGCGTNGFVSAWPVELFHLRSNSAASQENTAGLVVK